MSAMSITGHADKPSASLSCAILAAICISIELYEIVQLRSGDGVALTLLLTVGVVGLTLRGGGPLIRSYFIKKRT